MSSVCPEGLRFFRAFQYREVLTALDSTTMTFLDRRIYDRTFTPIRGAAWQFEGTLRSDDPDLYTTSVVDGLPKLSEGVRLLFVFRREQCFPLAPWVLRFAGMVLNLDRSADADIPATRMVAYDPRQYLYRRPIRNADGELPGQFGLSYDAGTTGDVVVKDLLTNSIVTDGPLHLDAGAGAGGTGFWAGTIETTAPLPDGINFQHGESLGEAFDALEATGTMDIVLDPIYDPVNRPGYCSDLSVFTEAGVVRNEVIFSWDKPGRNATEFGLTRDGTQRANNVQYYAGPGGPPVPPQTTPASISEFGVYFEQQFYPGQTKAAVVEDMAAKTLRLKAQGVITQSISPTPERNYVPLRDYGPADHVWAYASNHFGETVADLVRVESIPITITDEGAETVRGLLVSQPGETGS